MTQALIDGGHRALGLCNVAIGMQRWLAGWLEVEPERVSLEHVGLNHLSWVRAVRVDGRDVLPTCWRTTPSASPSTPGCRWTWSGPWAPSRPTTCATTT